MTFLPITLGVTRISIQEEPLPLFAKPLDEMAAKAAVFREEDNTCRFCGFTASRYQQLHFLNGNRRDWSRANLATCCTFCDQCLALERVAPMRAGTLIWLPEVGQGALHHICRAIYVARISSGSMADAARLALDTLLLRREEARRRIGTDDPAILSTALQDYLENPDYNERKHKLDGIRLLPLDRRIIREADIEFNQFPQILAFWRSKDGPFGGALPTSWADSFQEIAEVTA